VHAVTGPSELDGAVNETIEEKAVALLYGVAKAHAFFDGNKRTAWFTFTTFLNLNGLRFTEQISGYQDDMVVDLVEDRITKDDVIGWLREQVNLGRAVDL
jgi:death-on-curing protein